MRLYALCDQDMLDKKDMKVEEFIRIAKSHSAEIIQYRNKTATVDFVKQQLIAIRKLYDGYLVVNDMYELVEYCDGIHLGQEDLRKIDSDIEKSVKIVRNTIGKDKILGISTHNEKEIIEANNMNLNYIGLGAFRDTSTKIGITTVLGDNLDNIASLSNHHVAAIGGVKMDDVFQNVTYHVIGSGLIS